MAEPLSTVARLWRSAWDPQAYRNAALCRMRNLFAYLAVLMLIATASITVSAQLAANQAVAQFKQEQSWDRNLPEIRIVGGKASSTAQQPFVHTWGRGVFILDTSGTVTDLDATYPQGILITRSDVVYRRDRGVTAETRRYSLERLPDMLVNQDTLERLLGRLVPWVWLVVGVATLLSLWIAQPIGLLFWSLVGLAVSAIAKRELLFAAIFKIAVVALTPSLLFDVVKRQLGLQFPGLGFISFVLYVGYLVFGILAQPKPAMSVPMSKSALTAP